MCLKLALSACLAVAAITVGCNKQDDTKTTPAPTAPPVPKSTAAASPGTTTDSPMAPMPAGATTSPPAAANGAAADASNATQAQAQQLMDQAMQYIKENKLDLAEKSLNQLDGMKSQLPPEWGPRIEQVRSALNAAKVSGAAGGLQLPGSK